MRGRQLYDRGELPPELIVVGSGVTGAEFASAYQALGSQVTLISSRERVLPQEDPDAAMVVEDVFRRRLGSLLGCFGHAWQFIGFVGLGKVLIGGIGPNGFNTEGTENCGGNRLILAAIL